MSESGDPKSPIETEATAEPERKVVEPGASAVSGSVVNSTVTGRTEKCLTYPIRFTVQTPEPLAPGRSVFLAGGGEALGGWAADGIKLEKTSDKTWTTLVDLPAGPHRCKFTQGTWYTVELSARGQNIRDREFLVQGAAAISITIGSWGDRRRRPRWHSYDEHVEDLGSFGEETAGEAHRVWVHVPPGYDPDGGRAYPLVYMLDGQNMFDRATAFAGQPWDADEIHDKLLDHGWIRPFFIVAIQHGVSREDLYTPYRDKHYNVGGKLPLTAMMIRKEIEPVIRRRYRLLNGPENTGIIGSSLGGLAAFHLGLLYPARFGHVGAMSASLWWSDFKSHRRIKSKALKVSSTRFWLDVGTRESPAPENTVLQVRTVAQALENRGFDVTFYTDVGAWHTERVWRRRIRDVFRWMFGRRRIKRAA